MPQTDVLDETPETVDLDELAPEEDGPSSPEEAAAAAPSHANLRFETKKFGLQALLEKTMTVLPSRDIMPVLKNFQVAVEDDHITVVATDLELSVVARNEMISNVTAGTAVFPGKALMEIIREAEDGDLLVDVTDGTARISVGRARWELRLMDGSEYPPIPDIDEVELHPVDRGKFLGAINAVRYAAATDTVRPTLMMISIRDGYMRAADGVRYQQVELGQDWPLDMDIPINAVNDLTKLLRTTDGSTVEIGESENHLVFRIGEDTFIANKLSAEFPDVENIILRPALANDKHLSADRDDLMAAIRRVRVTSDKNTSGMLVNLTRGTITLTCRDKFGNNAYETIDAHWEDEDRELAVNHTMLLQMLEMSDAKSVQFFLGVDTKQRKTPLLLRDEEAGLVGVLTQMRADFIS